MYLSSLTGTQCKDGVHSFSSLSSTSYNPLTTLVSMRYIKLKSIIRGQTEELKVVCPAAKSIILSTASEMLVDT